MPETSPSLGVSAPSKTSTRRCEYLHLVYHTHPQRATAIVSGVNAKRICAVAGLVTVISAAVAAPAPAALQVSQFSLTPSTQRAGGHPSVALSTAFLGADTNSGVKSIALRLPAGLRTRPSVASVCSARLLIRNDCPIPSRVGQVKVFAGGFPAGTGHKAPVEVARAEAVEIEHGAGGMRRDIDHR